MKFLSIDIEATGLDKHDRIIEFAMIPIDTKTKILNDVLARRFLIKCPSFNDLKNSLNPWVIKHNKKLITEAHENGISIAKFKKELEQYLESAEVKKFFNLNRNPKNKIIVFGKSLNSIDLPFLKRDLGHDFYDKYFHHHVIDLTSISYYNTDLNFTPKDCYQSSKLMKYFGMGKVSHTAMDDARNTAIMYFKLLDKFALKQSQN